MPTEENKTKTWKTTATVDTYDEAVKQKEKLLKDNPSATVKIRRSEHGFRLKVWSLEAPKPTKKKKRKKKAKKKSE